MVGERVDAMASFKRVRRMLRCQDRMLLIFVDDSARVARFEDVIPEHDNMALPSRFAA